MGESDGLALFHGLELLEVITAGLDDVGKGLEEVGSLLVGGL